jgi:hypothetical protein
VVAVSFARSQRQKCGATTLSSSRISPISREA